MWYDLVVLAILGYATLRGAAKGIVWQLAVIAALVLCFVFSGSLSVALAPLIPVQPPLNRWIAMFALYVGFSFLSFAAARSLRQGIEKAKFEEYDRHLGGVLGLVKGLVFCLVLTFFSVTFSQTLRDTVMQSYSGYAAAVIMDRLHPVMPDGMHKVLEPYIHQLDRPGMDLRHAHGHDHGHADDHAPHGDHDPWDHSRDTVGTAPAPEEPDWTQDRGPSDPFHGEGWFGIEDDLARLLPKSLSPELRGLALDALRNTAPEDRDELVRRLSTGAPSVVRQIAQEWLDGRPADGRTDVAPSHPTPDARSERQSLLGEIAATYVDAPADRQRFVADQERLLTGLPTRVELAVLHDWHADILSLDPQTDPDPQTDFRTDLPTRIVRQLAAANVPLSSLSSDLQTRLRGVRLR